jgi:hypothetical protein
VPTDISINRGTRRAPSATTPITQTPQTGQGRSHMTLIVVALSALTVFLGCLYMEWADR